MIVVIGNIRTTTFINTITTTILAKLVIGPRYHLLDQQHHYQILSTFFIKTAPWLSSTSGTRRWRCWKLCLSSPWATWSLDRWASICSWWWWLWWWCRCCPAQADGNLCSWWCRWCPTWTGWQVFVLGGGDDGVVAVLLRHLLFMGTVMLLFDYTLGKAYYSIPFSMFAFDSFRSNWMRKVSKESHQIQTFTNHPLKKVKTGWAWTFLRAVM